MDGADCFGIEPRTLIWKIIAGYTSDGCVAKFHGANRLSNAAWLIAIKWLWLTCINIAEVATTSTTLATD